MPTETPSKPKVPGAPTAPVKPSRPSIPIRRPSEPDKSPDVDPRREQPLGQDSNDSGEEKSPEVPAQPAPSLGCAVAI